MKIRYEKKNALALIVVLFITVLSFAQNQYQDVVYLKNGSVIRGVIVEQVPGVSIKIETADRNVFFYKTEDIKKFTKELKVENTQTLSSNKSSKKVNKDVIEFGYLFGTGDISFDRIKLNFIGSYRISDVFYLGHGTGLRYIADSESLLMPIFADLKLNFTKNNNSPYLAMDVGYSLNLTDSFSGVGFIFSPTLAASFEVSDKTNMTVGISYEIQRAETYYDYYSYSSSKKSYGALGINIGWVF